MPSLNKRDAERQFARKMQGEIRIDGDHRRYRFYLDGELVLGTMVSHSGETLGSALVGMMARQLEVSISDLAEYVRCTLSADDWSAHLHQVMERRRLQAP